MAITIDWATKVISVPQSDLTLVSGTLYELDTNQFRKDLKALEASEEGMPFEDTHLHNTEVTVAGTTFARTIEIINGYSVEFTPDSQWSVRLAGSNNNIFDVENGILVQNQVQVIPGNSGGLISGDSIQDSLVSILGMLTTVLGNTSIVRKLMTNRAEITVNGDTSRTIELYDDDQTTIIETLNISSTGLTRTNP